MSSTPKLTPERTDQPPDLSVGLVQDSLRKTAEEALQRSEAVFHTIAENSGDLITIVEYPGMQTLYVSPTYPKLLGYSVEELQNRSSLEVVHPDDLPALRQAVERMALEGEDGNIVVALTGAWLVWGRGAVLRRPLPARFSAR